MSWQAPNLAREPFENLRPVRRISALIASIALALTAWNVGTWWRVGAGAAEKVAEHERLTTDAAAARARIATLEGDLGAADLEARNREAEFLNDRIAERTFSFNRLLDRLVETMPRGVRVHSLTPQRDAVERSSSRAGSVRRSAPSSASSGLVTLKIDGEAQDDEALLEFVDRLFAHPAFLDPDLASESRTSTGGLEFALTVAYRPEAEPAAVGAPIPAVVGVEDLAPPVVEAKP